MNKVIREDMESILDYSGDFDGCTVLLSGANSFFMSYFVYFLLERNRLKNADIHIIALIHNMEAAMAKFADYLSDEHLHLVHNGARDEMETWNEIREWERIDYCIHAASPAGIFSRQANPLETFEVNVEGCRKLLELCRDRKVRKFMLISSVDVYGKLYQEERIREDDMGYLDLLYPRNAYANGKRTAEILCGLYHAVYHIPTVIVRPYQVFGPGMNLYDGRLHGDFIRQIKEKGDIMLKSDGKAKRSFLYILDATLALMLCLLKGEAGQAYNLCDESGEASVWELAEAYVESCKEDVKIILDFSQRETKEVTEALPIVTGDCAKIRKLGFQAKTDLKTGIRKTLSSYGIEIKK